MSTFFSCIWCGDMYIINKKFSKLKFVSVPLTGFFFVKTFYFHNPLPWILLLKIQHLSIFPSIFLLIPLQYANLLVQCLMRSVFLLIFSVMRFHLLFVEAHLLFLLFDMMENRILLWTIFLMQRVFIANYDSLLSMKINLSKNTYNPFCLSKSIVWQIIIFIIKCLREFFLLGLLKQELQRKILQNIFLL